ncbi:MAG: DUF1800 domain-containing protein [Acidobacteriota bacterium]
MQKHVVLRILLVVQLLIGMTIRDVVFAAVWETPIGGNSAQQRLSETQKIVHVLNRFAFGPCPGDVERVRRLGLDRYFEQQLDPTSIDDSGIQGRLKELSTLNMSPAELAENFSPPQRISRQSDRIGRSAQERTDKDRDEEDRKPRVDRAEAVNRRRVIAELSQAKMLRAVYSKRQLQEVMVDFWTNHFNVFAAKGADRWFITSFERDVIRPHALGKFRELLGATAKSPAMLFYLDNWLSADPESAEKLSRWGKNRRFRRNRDRWAMSRRLSGSEETPAVAVERKTRPLGLNENYARELMELHTLGVDGGYTQKDVTEVARCFTGWTIQNPRRGGSFRFVGLLHDRGEKEALGIRIPSGGGIQDGEKVLDLLATHPSTARFIAGKLARKFVSDEPPQALVDRMAETFRRSDGNIQEVLRTLYHSPEFSSEQAYRSKVKTPFELVASSLRALDAETSGGRPILLILAQMGEPLFLCQPPTGYPDTAEAWVNTGAMLHRMNFGLALAANRIPGTWYRPEVQRDTTTTEDVVAQLAGQLLQGDVSPETIVVVSQDIDPGGQENPVPSSSLIAKAIGLLLGSPDFQRQ